MFDSLFKNLQNSLTELSDFIEEGQKKMNKDELKLFNSYKGRIIDSTIPKASENTCSRLVRVPFLEPKA